MLHIIIVSTVTELQSQTAHSHITDGVSGADLQNPGVKHASMPLLVYTYVT